MIGRFLQSQLRRNVASGAIASVLNVVILLVSYRIYLERLGYELYGLWLVLAGILAFAQMGELGIDQAITKLVAEERGRGDSDGTAACLTCGLAILTISGTLVTGVIVLFKSPIIAAVGLDAKGARIVTVLLPFVGMLCVYTMLVNAMNATLSGLGRMDLANCMMTFRRAITAIVSCALLIAGVGVRSILIGSAAALLLHHVACVLLIHRIARIRILSPSGISRHRIRRLLQFGTGVFGSSLLAVFVEPFSKLMLARYAGLSAVPVFHLALRGAVLVRSIAASALGAIMPEISRLGSTARKNAAGIIRRLNRRALLVIGGCGLPLYCALFIAAKPLFALWLRQEYRPEIPVTFRIILVCMFLSSLGLPAYYTVMGLGRVYQCMISNGIITCINVISVLAVLVVAGFVSPGTIAWGLVPAFGISTLYIVLRARQVTGSLVAVSGEG